MKQKHCFPIGTVLFLLLGGLFRKENKRRSKKRASEPVPLKSSRKSLDNPEKVC